MPRDADESPHMKKSAFVKSLALLLPILIKGQFLRFEGGAFAAGFQGFLLCGLVDPKHMVGGGQVGDLDVEIFGPFDPAPVGGAEKGGSPAGDKTGFLINNL